MSHKVLGYRLKDSEKIISHIRQNKCEDYKLFLHRSEKLILDYQSLNRQKSMKSRLSDQKKDSNRVHKDEINTREVEDLQKVYENLKSELKIDKADTNEIKCLQNELKRQQIELDKKAELEREIEKYARLSFTSYNNSYIQIFGKANDNPHVREKKKEVICKKPRIRQEEIKPVNQELLKQRLKKRWNGPHWMNFMLNRVNDNNNNNVTRSDITTTDNNSSSKSNAKKIVKDDNINSNRLRTMLNESMSLLTRVKGSDSKCIIDMDEKSVINKYENLNKDYDFHKNSFPRQFSNSLNESISIKPPHRRVKSLLDRIIEKSKTQQQQQSEPHSQSQSFSQQQQQQQQQNKQNQSHQQSQQQLQSYRGGGGGTYIVNDSPVKSEATNIVNATANNGNSSSSSNSCNYLERVICKLNEYNKQKKLQEIRQRKKNNGLISKRGIMLIVDKDTSSSSYTNLPEYSGVLNQRLQGQMEGLKRKMTCYLETSGSNNTRETLNSNPWIGNKNNLNGTRKLSRVSNVETNLRSHEKKYSILSNQIYGLNTESNELISELDPSMHRKRRINSAKFSQSQLENLVNISYDKILISKFKKKFQNHDDNTQTTQTESMILPSGSFGQLDNDDSNTTSINNNRYTTSDISFLTEINLPTLPSDKGGFQPYLVNEKGRLSQLRGIPDLSSMRSTSEKINKTGGSDTGNNESYNDKGDGQYCSGGGVGVVKSRKNCGTSVSSGKKKRLNMPSSHGNKDMTIKSMMTTAVGGVNPLIEKIEGNLIKTTEKFTDVKKLMMTRLDLALDTLQKERPITNRIRLQQYEWRGGPKPFFTLKDARAHVEFIRKERYKESEKDMQWYDELINSVEKLKESEERLKVGIYIFEILKDIFERGSSLKKNHFFWILDKLEEYPELNEVSIYILKSIQKHLNIKEEELEIKQKVKLNNEIGIKG